MCFYFLEVLFGVYVRTVTREVIGSGHQVESCNISIRLYKVIHSPPVPFSRVICRFQLLFLLGCLLDGDIGNYSAV